MKPIHQRYIDNLSTACGLAKPTITPEMSPEEMIAAIRDNANAIHLLHKENDQILQEILFSRKPEELTAEEAGDLFELAGALFQFNQSPDTGIAYRIHKLLYAYAQVHQDTDLIIRELYCQGITLLYLNVRDTHLGINVFLDEIGSCFQAGADYLDRFEQIGNPETRGYIIRCLGNLKYGLKRFQGNNDGERNFHISDGWPEYTACFQRAMAVINSPRYRRMAPEIPWDSFAYTMHYDRTQFLSALREEDNPEMSRAVLESAEYVYHHQEQIAQVQGRAIGVRTIYVYTAARYHAGLATLEELLEALFRTVEEAGLHDFSGDNIWALLYTPEYLSAYASQLPPEKREALDGRLRQAYSKQREFLFLLPRNEYAIQVSKTLRAINLYGSSGDNQFFHRSLAYILACHPPTFIHSKVVALLARRFCRRMAETAPELLEGLFGQHDIAGDPEKLEQVLEQAYHCGLYHDLGKCMLLNYVGLYSRRLLDEEFACIKLHPVFGCGLLESMGMKDIASAAHYHHCAYDGCGGYPRRQRECPPETRRIVDIITVVDSLDAGTDNVGRSYAAAKSFAQLVEELRAGAGSRYAPEVVALLDDPAFYAEIERFLTESRNQVYIEAYLNCK